MEYGDLYDRLFDSYIEEKSNPIVGTLEQRLYAGHFDWNDCLKPTGKTHFIIFTKTVDTMHFIPFPSCGM